MLRLYTDLAGTATTYQAIKLGQTSNKGAWINIDQITYQTKIEIENWASASFPLNLGSFTIFTIRLSQSGDSL